MGPSVADAATDDDADDFDSVGATGAAIDANCMHNISRSIFTIIFWQSKHSR